VQFDEDPVIAQISSGELATDGLRHTHDHLGVGRVHRDLALGVDRQALPQHPDLESPNEFGIIGIKTELRFHVLCIVTPSLLLERNGRVVPQVATAESPGFPEGPRSAFRRRLETDQRVDHPVDGLSPEFLGASVVTRK
jgi:hypothetical protein